MLPLALPHTASFFACLRMRHLYFSNKALDAQARRAFPPLFSALAFPQEHKAFGANLEKVPRSSEPIRFFCT